MLVPKSLGPKGATEELAELVALGLATHGLLAFAAAILAVFAGWVYHAATLFFFAEFDRWLSTTWSTSHPSEAILLVSGYVFLSFFVSHCLGLVYGVFSADGQITARLFAKAEWLQRLGVRGLLGERPIIYELLNAELSPSGDAKTMFVEAAMKDGLGFYSGQLSQFAIVRDEEPHRPVYLIDVWFKKDRDDLYVAVEADGVLLDLADVSTLLIKQMDLSNPLPVPDLKP